MVRAAIVGLGSWGQRLVRSVQGKSSSIEIGSCVTRTVANAKGFADSYGLPISDDLNVVLDDPSIEAVILATPHSQHVEQVKAAAARGKHIFVEKPLALTKSGVQAAVCACENAGVVLAVGQNRRFLPSVSHIVDLIRSGELGEMLHIEGNYSGPSGWAHSKSAWRADEHESPWGGMTGKGLHVSDLMILFAGRIVEVDARSSRRVLTTMDDTTAMLLRFASGAQGYLGTLTATADVWRMQAFGTRGWVEMRGLDTLIIGKVKEQERVVRFDPCDIERAELEAFAQAVRKRTPFPVPLGDVENNVAFLEAIGRSIASSGPVAV